jgi:HEAT repeat protein
MSTPGDESPASHPDPATDTPAARQQAHPLAEFTLDLAKAMLRTGYYAPDHPQAQLSRAGLYEEFCRVLEDRAGLTYLVGMDRDHRTLMIDGYDPDPLMLDTIMISGMAELFTPKLLDFFNRRHLLSFSLLVGIEAEEFNAFIVLMSEPPRAGRADEERDRVTQAFVDQHIVHVSTLFEADVLGRERRLPWRVERALSRLGRDLSMLPLYKKASPEKLQQIKIQIIDEVIRPLRTPQLLADLLVNCDILAKDIAVLEEAQVEREIIAQIPPERLVSTTGQLIESLQQLTETQDEESSELANRHRLIIRDILNQLGEAEVEVAGELLEAVVKQNVFARGELPESLQRMLKRQLVVREFLANSDDYLRGMAHFPAGEFGKRLNAIARVVFPELVRRGGHWAEAAGIFEALRSGGHETEAGETVQALLHAFGRFLAVDEEVRQLLNALSDELLDKEARDAVVALLSISGEAAVEGLQETYAASTSVSVRASAFEVMKGIGTPALVPFLKALPNIEPEWSAIHHVLAALDGQSDPALADSIKPFLRHENARVRQAALTRVFELLGPDSETSLIRALHDSDAVTRRAAVTCLGGLHSQNPEVLAFYAGILQPESVADDETEDEEVVVEVCRSLTGVGEAAFPDGSSAEQVLLAAVHQEGRKKRISGMFQKPPLYHGERVRVAICEALGTVGTERAIETLQELASSEADTIAEAARAAVEQIQERGHDARGAPPGPVG